ncbi:MAG: AI-2E family transporter [Firmicutes bacterium]|nr:AI-2E family transporter [Bacillota bacterium]
MQLRAWLARPAVRWGAGAAAVGTAAGLAYALRGTLAPFLLAAGLAYLLAPLVEWAVRHGLGRAWAVLLVYALVGVVLAALVAFAVPVFVNEVQNLADRLPQYTRQVQAGVRHVQKDYARAALPPTVRDAVDAAVERAEASLQARLRAFLAGLVGLVRDLALLAIAPVLAFYMLVDLPRLKRASVRWLPPEARHSLVRYFAELDAMLSGYVRGQLMLAFIVGALATLALAVLGVPYALLLGAFAGLGELIPYFGPVAGAVPSVAVALTVSSRLALSVIVAFVIIQQLESAVVGPFVMRTTLGLHPLLVIFSLLAGGQLAGLAGVILSVPFMGFLVVTGRFLYRILVR